MHSTDSDFATRDDNRSNRPQQRPAAGPAAPRHDLYQPIHKALRAFMARVLVDLGRLDTDDAAEAAATLDQTATLLALMASHIEHEDRFVHPALEALKRDSATRVAEDHGAHRASIEALQAEVRALQSRCAGGAWPAQPPAAEAALRLYRRFALFMAENIEHMHHEETVLQGALWAGYSDAELQTIHAALLASIAPAETALVLHWMLPALTPMQRAGMLGGMQAQLPPEAMQPVLDAAQAVLDAPAWAKLARALGLLPVPGLVMV